VTGSARQLRRAVLFDLGNSSWKVALAEWGTGPQPMLRELGRGPYAEQDPWAPLAGLWAEHGLKGCPIAVSSVASAARATGLRERLSDLDAADIAWHPDPGLELCVRNAHTVGLDRLYAARAAWQRVGARPAIVVDAGTAVTVDAVGPGESPSGAAFLGGAIAPGPDLLARALALGGAQLWAIDPKPGAPALGKETSEALVAGVVVGLEGAVLRLAERVAAEAGFEAPVLVLTGGATGFVAQVLRGLGWELVEDPLLVLRGLALALGESADGV